MENIKFAIYARKSSTGEDRQVLSIESQLEEMKELAERLGVKVHHVFTDSQTAHKPNLRTGFNEMMGAVNGGEIDGILVWKADRLARNPIEGGSLLYALQNNLIKVIQTPYNRFIPTDNTLPLTIELGMANQYSIDLSRNVKRGNRTKIDKGGWCGVAPHGYLNDKLEKTVIVDSERFHMVRKMWDLMLTGLYSISQICNIANEEWRFRTIQKKKIGGGKLAASSLYLIFTNPFYYGWAQCGENGNFGNHQPMVTQGEFEKVQQILRRRGRQADTNPEFALTGNIKCGECGCGITAEEKVKYRCPKCNQQHNAKVPIVCRCGYQLTLDDVGSGNWYVYYRCTKKKGKCCQKYINEKFLEQQIDSAFLKLELDPAFEQWAVKWFKALNHERYETKKVEDERFMKDYEGVQSMMKRLMDLRLDGEISKEEYALKKTELDIEKEVYKKRLEKADNVDDQWIKKAEKEIDFVEGIRDRFNKGCVRDKRYIFTKIGSNFILKDKKLQLEASRKYLVFKELQDIADLRLEPQNVVLEKGESVFDKTPYSTWLPGTGSNRRPIGYTYPYISVRRGLYHFA